jgi:4-amino-4-deoxy-L-arabinose transferase-like glycosyltransferase
MPIGRHLREMPYFGQASEQTYGGAHGDKGPLLHRQAVRISRYSPRFGLAVVLIVAAVFRFGGLLLRAGHESRFLEPDSSDYLSLSRNLGAFTSKSNPYFYLGVLRTPVYPFYLFVTHLITHSRVLGPMILQVIVGVGVVYVTYRLGLSLFSRSVGLCAAAIIAVDPLSITYSSLVLAESLYALFLTASVVVLWRPKGNQWKRGLAAGILLGLATLTRPVSIYVFVALAVGYLALEWKDLRGAILVVVCFLVGFSVLAGGWIIRNYETTHVATISSIEGDNLLYYRAAGALEESEHISLSAARAELSRQLKRKLPPKANPGQVAQAEQTLGITVIREHPTGYFKEVLAGAVRLVLGDSHSEFSTVTGPAETRLLVGYAAAYLLCVYLLVAVGLWSAWRTQNLRSCLLPVITIVYTIVVSSGLEAYSRFRVPIMPYFALIAAVGAVALLGHKRGSDRVGAGVEAAPAFMAR